MAPLPIPRLQSLSLPSLPSLPALSIRDLVAALLPRQSNIIPTNYTGQNPDLPSGTIVGIVIGSVFGFLLLLWLIYTLFGGGPILVFGTPDDAPSVVVRRRGSARSGTRSAHSRRRSETVEVRRPAVERVVVEERRTREVRSESSTTGEDEVVVIEEHSPPPRRKSKRESGYRTVDPLAFGGGDRPMRDVRRDSGRTKR